MALGDGVVAGFDHFVGLGLPLLAPDGGGATELACVAGAFIHDGTNLLLHLRGDGGLGEVPAEAVA